MPTTIHRSKSKPEIEFQYGGRPVSETGSSYILAVDWDISSKFGTHIHFHILKQIPSLNLNPEVHFRLYGRYLEKTIWRHNFADDRPITTKFGRQMQNCMPMTTHRSKSKPEIKFQYGGRPSSKTGSSYISAVDWVISSKFGTRRDFHLKQIGPGLPSLNLNPEVHFLLCGRHLEKSKSKPEIEFQYGGIRPNTAASSNERRLRRRCWTKTPKKPKIVAVVKPQWYSAGIAFRRNVFTARKLY